MKVKLKIRFYRGDKEAIVCLLLCCDGKEVSLKLTKYPIVGKDNLNLVIMDHMKNDKTVVVV
jgi:hypothetical protein